MSKDYFWERADHLLAARGELESPPSIRETFAKGLEEIYEEGKRRGLRQLFEPIEALSLLLSSRLRDIKKEAGLEEK